MHILFYTCNLTSNVYLTQKCHCIKKDVTIILHGKLVTSLCFHKTFSPLALMAVTIGEGQKAHDKYMSQYRSQLSLLQPITSQMSSVQLCHNTARSYRCCNSRPWKPLPRAAFQARFEKPNEFLLNFSIKQLIFTFILLLQPLKLSYSKAFTIWQTP